MKDKLVNYFEWAKGVMAERNEAEDILRGLK